MPNGLELRAFWMTASFGQQCACPICTILYLERYKSVNLGRKWKTQQPVGKRNDGLPRTAHGASDFRVPRVKAAGQRTKGREDDLAFRQDEAAPRHALAPVHQAEFGMEMAGKLWPGVTRVGLVPE